MGEISIKTLGVKGVNTDKDPLELAPDELVSSQNAISEPLGAQAGITNRPGLAVFTPVASNDGEVLGGIGVLAPSGFDGGEGFLFLGRGGVEVP